MVDSKLLGRITILEVSDNNNGTCKLTYEVPEELKAAIKRHFGWKHWSSKKFNTFFLEALTNHAKTLERESRAGADGGEHLIDVFDNKSV